jgi:TRAP transporter TAXI family solute receptor
MDMKNRIAILWLLVLVLGACSRGPDQGGLQQDLQLQLDSGFQDGLFKVVTVRRQGSAPVIGGGESRILVYHNTTIEFLEPHSLGGWSDVGLGSLGALLGATEKGIEGVKPEGNAQGDLIMVHGRSTYRETDDGWEMVAGQKDSPTDVSSLALDNTAPPSGLRQLVTTMEAVADGASREQQPIVKQELGLALRKIQLKLDQSSGVRTLVTGEPAGEYFGIGQALQNALAGGELQLSSYDSAGSVENLELVDAGTVTLALVQNDVAAMAFAGEGVFAGRTPMANLRALGSLFPEPIQVVVLQSSDITDVAGLKGRKVDIGAPGSGSRANAEQLLEAHGLALSDLAEAREDGLAASLEAIAAGEIDAFVTTIAAPARGIQGLAADHPLRILSLAPAAMDMLRESNPALVPLTIPANAYPGQAESADTLAVTAMLVAREDMPAEVAEGFVNEVFDSAGEISQRHFNGSRISRATAREGVTIPIHPGAEKAL